MRLVLAGYTPSTRNQLNGCHWTVLLREKKRDGMALRESLKSLSQYLLVNPVTGTAGILNACKIGVSKLDSFRTTDGQLFLVGSSPKKYTRKPRKEPK